MAFALPDEAEDIAQALREAETQAPKALKPLLIQAAQRLDAYKVLCADGASALELAASLRAGQMDSQSRADEIAQQQRLMMRQFAERMRELA